MKALFLAASAVVSTATLPASAQVVIIIGNSLAEGCYRAAETRNTSPEAIDTCNRALTQQAISFEDRFATYVNRGILRMFKRDYEVARMDFRAAAAMAPNRPEPWLHLGIMLYNEGDSAGSIPLFNRALELGTDAPEIAYYGRGLAYEDRGNLQAAYADLSRAAALKPGWDKPAQELARYEVRRR